MLLPFETAIAWVLLIALAVVVAWRGGKYQLAILGLLVAVAGAVYYPVVMVKRPLHYYAILEFLASTLAAAAGAVVIMFGIIQAICTSQPDDR